MGNLPQIEAIRKIPLTIHRQPYLMDHRFEGRTVYPAVEAMQMLASSTRECCPEANIRVIQNARFDKFLMMSEKQDVINVFHELCRRDDGMIESRLVTRTTSKKLAISRQKEHVAVCFASDPTPEPERPSGKTMRSLTGDVFTVSSRDVYRKLVPFGPSYHNITGDLLITEQGAVADLAAPDCDAAIDPLGSPLSCGCGLSRGLCLEPALSGIYRISGRFCQTDHLSPHRTRPEIYDPDYTGQNRSRTHGVRPVDLGFGRNFL